MMKVIVTDEISEQGLELLQHEPRVQLDVRLGLDKAELHRIIGDYDAIITRSGTQVDAELLEHAKQLKMVARAGVGIDNVDVPAASERGIIVVNAPFGNTNSAAGAILPSSLAAKIHHNQWLLIRETVLLPRQHSARSVASA